MTVWWKSRSFSDPPSVYEGAQECSALAVAGSLTTGLTLWLLQTAQRASTIGSCAI
jgi:hypothetical protein